MLKHAPAALRQLLKDGDLIWAPGVYDGYSARIADAVGFPALYMTGAGVTASRLGQPDLGLISLTEMVDAARTIASVASVPVIADADTGFGGPVNVARTVHLFEQAGVAAIHIEDQTFPKRCGHLQGKAVASVEEFTQRIRAASTERFDPDFIIIARTDARAVNGLEDAIDRVERAFDAGADVGFVEAPLSIGEMERIIERASGPMLINIAANGRTPNLNVDQVRALGFRMAIWPGVLSRAGILAMRVAANVFKATGTDAETSRGLSPRDVFEMVGLAEAIAIDERAGATALAGA